MTIHEIRNYYLENTNKKDLNNKAAWTIASGFAKCHPGENNCTFQFIPDMERIHIGLTLYQASTKCLYDYLITLDETDFPEVKTDNLENTMHKVLKTVKQITDRILTNDQNRKVNLYTPFHFPNDMNFYQVLRRKSYRGTAFRIYPGQKIAFHHTYSLAKGASDVDKLMRA